MFKIDFQIDFFFMKIVLNFNDFNVGLVWLNMIIISKQDRFENIYLFLEERKAYALFPSIRSLAQTQVIIIINYLLIIFLLPTPDLFI